MCSVIALAANGETPSKPNQEPTLHDHYVSLKIMQERLAGRTLDEQAKLQPQIQRAQQKACQRLRKDHQERIPREQYRQQGGNEFLVFSLELEQWCATIH
jgi:hypothetical protein